MAAPVNSISGHGADVWTSVSIQIAGFTARETNGEYAEKNVLMRVTHHGFHDSHIIGRDELRRAMNNSAIVQFGPFVFKKPRARYMSDSGQKMTLPYDSILELQLFAQTANSSEQDCVKTEGAFRQILLRNQHNDNTSRMNASVDYNNVRFVCECTEGMFRPGSRSEIMDGIKASAKLIRVRAVASGHVVAFQRAEGYTTLSVMGMDDRARGRLQNAIRAHQVENENAPVSAEKLRHYYSLQYKLAEGIALPASTYMYHMMSRESMPVPMGVVRKMFECALDEHPEFGDPSSNMLAGREAPDKLWLARSNAYLSAMKRGDVPAVNPATQDDVTFIDCLKVAMSVLTAYPNAVPYLLDMEIDATGKQKCDADMFAHVYSDDLPATGEKYDASLSAVAPVERFAQAVMESYGTDCEDFAIFSHWLKLSIQTQFINSSDPIMRTLAKIYELFISCVMHMFCTGDDAQNETDDGVYHFALYMIPRMYMADCWKRGGAAVEIFSKRTKDAREWEADYKKHLGVFVVEGTNTVDPAQFEISAANRQLRTSNTQHACLGIRNIASVDTQKRLNVYHSYVFAKPTQLSGFYRWALSMFCTETDRDNVIDMGLFNARTQKGVRVEALAEMRGDVKIKQTFRYEKPLYDLCMSLLELYRPPYRGLTDTDEKDEPALVGCILASSPRLRKLAGAARPTKISDRRRNVRVHIQHLDFSAKYKHRAQDIVTGLEEFSIGMNATSLQICSKVLGATWCSPDDMTLTRTDTKHRVVKLFVIFFY